MGRGAMGVTYKAFDVDLRCPVTLKVISERYLGDESARLLQQIWLTEALLRRHKRPQRSRGSDLDASGLPLKQRSERLVEWDRGPAARGSSSPPLQGCANF